MLHHQLDEMSLGFEVLKSNGLTQSRSSFQFESFQVKIDDVEEEIGNVDDGDVDVNDGGVDDGDVDDGDVDDGNVDDGDVEFSPCSPVHQQLSLLPSVPLHIDWKKNKNSFKNLSNLLPKS